MKPVSPKSASLFMAALMVAGLLSSCKNERQIVVDESIRLIGKATVMIQDVNNIELRQLKDIPENLQDSLYVLQNKYPNVRLSQDDEQKIKLAMGKFTQAQENAIVIFTRRVDALEESIVKLTNNEPADDTNES